MFKPRNFTLEREDSVISADYETTNECCMDDDDDQNDQKTEQNITFNKLAKISESDKAEIIEMETTENNEKLATIETTANDVLDGRTVARKRVGHACGENSNNYAEHKNVAEGLMDIALLSANANQLRFLITYNNKASTYFISLGLVVLSLALQVAVGIALIFKRRIKRSRMKRTHNRVHEFLIGGVFMVTVINVLLAAFTTTDNKQNN